MTFIGEVVASSTAYAYLKTVAQWMTYVGLVATSVLSIYDQLYKQRSDSTDTADRYVLNPAGRRRLAAFILVSVLTLLSIITKDYADGKLSTLAAASAKIQHDEDAKILRSTNEKTDLLLGQNLLLHDQITNLPTALESTSGPDTDSQNCLRRIASNQLKEINAFFKQRGEGSPAHDASFANDPSYSDKYMAYQQETSRLYVEKFWRSVQELLRRGVQQKVTPEGTTYFADSSFYPDAKWWQATLNPGYKELTLISEQAPECHQR